MHIKTFLIALFTIVALGLSAQSHTEGETFLIHQTEGVQTFLADNADMELREATTPSGEVMGQFILTKQCQLCGITFPDAVVVITRNLPLFTTPGNIGLKFFERTQAIFDFDQSVVYMKGK